MNRTEQIAVARAHGIVRPGKAFAAAKEAGIPFHVLCAFLKQESNGGENIYGHDVDVNGNDGLPDPRPFWGHGEVTEANYAAYLRERDLGIREERFAHIGRRMQGVGPMQLTWWSYQDEADEAGGCWNPDVNTLVGARILARHYAAVANRSTGPHDRWWWVAKLYNGKAEYADQVAKRITTWAKRLGVTA